MKIVDCEYCKNNSDAAIMDEHAASGFCVNGKVEVPTTIEEWIRRQQPYTYPKEVEVHVIRVVKVFLSAIKNGLDISDFIK